MALTLCSRCGREKPIADFSIDHSRKNGRCSWCKKCAHNYYRKNNERIRASAERWQASHLDLVKRKNQRYYREHGPEIRKAAAAYYLAHSRECRRQRRAYYAKHKDAIREYQRHYRQEHLSRIRDYGRQRLESDPEKRRRQNECNRNYAHTHPAVVRRGNLVRQLRQKLANAGTFTNKQWNLLLEICEHRCLGCGVHESDAPRGQLTRDHVIPLSKISTDPQIALTARERSMQLISNIQPLCWKCNSRKGTRETDYRCRQLKRFLKRLARSAE